MSKKKEKINSDPSYQKLIVTTRLSLQTKVTITLLSVMCLCFFACIALFFLKAFGVVNIDTIDLSLFTAATVAQIAGIVTIVVKKIF